MKEDTFHPIRNTYRELTEEVYDLAENAGSDGVDLVKVRDNLMRSEAVFLKSNYIKFFLSNFYLFSIKKGITFKIFLICA